MEQQWPKTLWLVRHGQSAGNVAGAAAEAASLPSIDIVTRDVDTPLSTLGEQQSRALGRWFRDLPREGQPNVLLCSPYLRARATALLILETAGLGKDLALFKADERLREKEFGILDRLTKSGILERYPQLAEQRNHVGKFYFRPPGGESWCDVILRLRSILDTIVREQSRERVLIVSHESAARSGLSGNRLALAAVIPVAISLVAVPTIVAVPMVVTVPPVVTVASVTVSQRRDDTTAQQGAQKRKDENAFHSCSSIDNN